MPERAPRAIIRVGHCGWSYPDWRGVVYPPGAGSKFDALAYMSRFVDALEVNSSFYRPPLPRTTASWVRRVAGVERFRFTFKLHQRFTHERRKIYSPAELHAFVEGIRPASEAGVLATVLMQFPWSFRCTPSAFEWLERLANDLAGHPLVVEVRHASWDSDEARRRLRELGLSLCNIDQPQLRDCLGPAAHVTGSIGYVRLHGRRTETWFADGIEPFERYNYLYQAEELAEWVPRINAMADDADEVYVFSNNHYGGQGVANALQLRSMLEGGPVDVPPDLPAHFPALREIARSKTTGPGPAATLFDELP